MLLQSRQAEPLEQEGLGDGLGVEDCSCCLAVEHGPGVGQPSLEVALPLPDIGPREPRGHRSGRVGIRFEQSCPCLDGVVEPPLRLVAPAAREQAPGRPRALGLERTRLVKGLDRLVVPARVLPHLTEPIPCHVGILGGRKLGHEPLRRGERAGLVAGLPLRPHQQQQGLVATGPFGMAAVE